MRWSILSFIGLWDFFFFSVALVQFIGTLYNMKIYFFTKLNFIAIFSLPTFFYYRLFLSLLLFFSLMFVSFVGKFSILFLYSV